MLQGIQSIQDPAELRHQIDIFAKSSQGALATAELTKTQQEARASGATATEKESQMAWYKEHGGLPPGMMRYLIMSGRDRMRTKPDDKPKQKLIYSFPGENMLRWLQ